MLHPSYKHFYHSPSYKSLFPHLLRYYDTGITIPWLNHGGFYIVSFWWRRGESNPYFEGMNLKSLTIQTTAHGCQLSFLLILPTPRRVCLLVIIVLAIPIITRQLFIICTSFLLWLSFTPIDMVEPEGVEPSIPPCKGGSFPLAYGPKFKHNPHPYSYLIPIVFFHYHSRFSTNSRFHSVLTRLCV